MFIVWTSTYNMHLTPYLMGIGAIVAAADNDLYKPIKYETRDDALNAAHKVQRNYGYGSHFEVQEILVAPWTEREEAKFVSNEYTQPVWHNEIWYKKRIHMLNTFDHVSKTNPAHIAFIENATKGELGRITATTPGRYLKRFFDADLSQVEIERWAGRHREIYEEPPELMWARTPDEIEAVYSMTAAFGSCMQRAAKTWGKNIGHPTRVYGAGDLAVAYIKDGTRLLARALVWEAKNKVGRVYGDGDKLRGALSKYGISTKSTSTNYDTMEGAKLLRIQVGTFNKKGQTVPRVVGPYLDGHANCADTLDDKHLVIKCNTDNDRAQFYGSNQDGQYYGHPKCSGCGSYTDDIYTMYTKEDGVIVDKCACYSCNRKNKKHGEMAQDLFSGVYYDNSAFKKELIYTSSRKSAAPFSGPVELLIHLKQIFKSDLSGKYITNSYLAKTGDGKKLATFETTDTYFQSNMDGLYYPLTDLVEFGSRKFSNTQIKQIMQYDLFNPIQESIAA